MDDAAILAIVLGILGIILIPVLICSIIVLIANFKIFKKAGEEGWKCLIPYYNTWIECKFTGINQNWIWIILAAPVASGILEGIIEIGLFSLASIAILFYFNILRAVSTAQSFGKDTGFAVGLFMLPIVFYPILGFGKAEYVGPRPMKDFIFKNGNTTSTANNAQQAQSFSQTIPQTEEDEILGETPQAPTHQAPVQPKAEKFCTNCGAKLEAGTNFCTSCGTKAN